MVLWQPRADYWLRLMTLLLQAGWGPFVVTGMDAYNTFLVDNQQFHKINIAKRGVT